MDWVDGGDAADVEDEEVTGRGFKGGIGGTWAVDTPGRSAREVKSDRSSAGC